MINWIVWGPLAAFVVSMAIIADKVETERSPYRLQRAWARRR